MKVQRCTAVVVGIFLVFALVGIADAAIFTGSSGNLAASVEFIKTNSNLTVKLANTSTADTTVPSEVLTAVFFQLSGSPTLTPVSAIIAPGSSVIHGSQPAGGIVGSEWEYRNFPAFPGGGISGISSTGLGIFGGSGNFPGPDLEPQVPLGPMNYGLVSMGDNPATGNPQLTGNRPFVKYQVDYVLSGLPGGFDPETDISKIYFQYGTELNLIRSRTTPPIPEPATVLGITMGLAAIGGYVKKRFAD